MTTKDKSIAVQYVFSENNQVYIKNTISVKEEWIPVSFQWIPLLK
ncbi:MAG: hypothetical protein V3U92_14420 [Cellulophaga sp.]